MAKKTQDAPTLNGDTTGNTTNGTETTPAPAPAKPELSSPELDRLKGIAQDALKSFSAIAATGAYGSPEMEQSLKAVNKAQNDVEKERANLVQQAREQEIADRKNKIIGELQSVIDLYADAQNCVPKVNAGDMTIEQANEVNDKFKAQFDKVANMLTGGVKTPSAPKGEGTGTPRTGTLKEEIVSKYKEYRAAGKTNEEARHELFHTDKYNDGTMSSAVRAYQIEIGEVIPK